MIELVVVLTILAVVGAITVPMLPYGGPATETAFDDGAVLERARRVALREGADLIVTLDPAIMEYRISTPGDEALIESGVYQPQAGDSTPLASRWMLSRFGSRASVIGTDR